MMNNFLLSSSLVSRFGSAITLSSIENKKKKLFSVFAVSQNLYASLLISQIEMRAFTMRRDNDRANII